MESCRRWSQNHLAKSVKFCDVDCDVQDQAGSAKSNKFNGGAVSFRAGVFCCCASVFSGLGGFLGRPRGKLIIPWLGVQIPPGPPVFRDK